ncbi:MAG: ankyrin repeat domain-containing protein [Acidobacteria bacterium]|nr:ankyrin repeat domain-containing protein [Acidobacteriota bacterium]
MSEESFIDSNEKKTRARRRLIRLTRRAGLAAGLCGVLLTLAARAAAQETGDRPVLKRPPVETEETSADADRNLPQVMTVTTDPSWKAQNDRNRRLHAAVAAGELAIVKDLIVKGADVDAPNFYYGSVTPLFIAVEHGHTEIAEMLLDFGAKINARDDKRQTPLMRLDDDATPELAELLIKYGAKVRLVDEEGNNALILAARDARPEVLAVLIRHSDKIDARNDAGRTALMEAADADNLENVRALLDAGADARLKDKTGKTAFDLTTDREVEKLLKTISDFGFRISDFRRQNATDNRRRRI